jgi:hypothetical protein
MLHTHGCSQTLQKLTYHGKGLDSLSMFLTPCQLDGKETFLCRDILTAFLQAGARPLGARVH